MSIFRKFPLNGFKLIAGARHLHSSPAAAGIFNKIRSKPGIGAQSNRLSDQNEIFEIQVHLVRPHFMQDYLTETKRFVDLFREKESGAELVGSFTSEIGSQDEAVHIWRFAGGYHGYQKHYQMYRTDKELLDYRQTRNEMLRSRRNQICLRFAFWPDFEPRSGDHIYELRSYTLKPGNMLEWGNYWANGLRIRGTDNEAVCGLFSHIGDLHQVHHLWCYNDLVHRNDVRDLAWHDPNWSETVRKTVGLVDTMACRVLKATPFSPLQ